MANHPRTIQEIVENYSNRKEGLRKALTDGACSVATLAPRSCPSWPVLNRSSAMQMSTNSIWIVTRRRTTSAFTVRFETLPCCSEALAAFARHECAARGFDTIYTDIGHPLLRSTRTRDQLQGNPTAAGKWIFRQRKCQQSCLIRVWASTLLETAWLRKIGWL